MSCQLKAHRNQASTFSPKIGWQQWFISMVIRINQDHLKTKISSYSAKLSYRLVIKFIQPVRGIPIWV